MEKNKPVLERRQSVLRRILSLVKYAPESRGAAFQVANIQNVSRGGLTFFTEQEIKEDAILQFYFLPPNRKKPVEVRGKIVRRLRSPKNAKAFEMGVQFLDVSEDAKLAIRELETSFLEKQKKTRP